MGRIHWVRVIVVGLSIFIVNFLIIMVVVGLYAFQLGYEAKGQPDPEAIQAFAKKIAPIWGPILNIITTFFGSLLLLRKVTERPEFHGALIGLLVSFAGFGFRGIHFHGIVFAVLIILAGYAGGWLVGRKKKPPIIS